MKVVPTAKDFIDIVLSKTQRQTPTQNHAGWHISRIRAFYMRKVKFTQQSWHDRLTQIIDDFPKVRAAFSMLSSLQLYNVPGITIRLLCGYFSAFNCAGESVEMQLPSRRCAMWLLVVSRCGCLNAN